VRLSWRPILARAAEIVEATLDAEGVLLTLRGLHYRLVSEGLVPNTRGAYKRLSSLSAAGRRDGAFPDLHETVRNILVPSSWASPEQALADLRRWYRRDRTEGQEQTLILGVEKRAQADYLTTWYDEHGLPVVPMAGYASQTIVGRVLGHVAKYDRLATMLYAGDFDPSGEDMLRDLRVRLPQVELRRVALTASRWSSSSCR
jgi:hypothetical protein